MNSWKLSTIVLAAMLAGVLLAQVAGLGFVSAQSGATAKVQLDTSNCSYGVGKDYAVPTGGIVVQAQVDQYGQNVYVYDICK